MLKLNETADIVEYADCYDDPSEKGKSIFWALSGAMTEPENQDKKCTHILVSSKAKEYMDKYLILLFNYKSFYDGKFFMGAEIVVSKKIDGHIPKGVNKCLR